MRIILFIFGSFLMTLTLHASDPTSRQQPGQPLTQNSTKTLASELTPCTDPRPQACTMDYNPVCAELGDGSYKTYSNGCTSCADPDVVGYINGECMTKE